MNGGLLLHVLLFGLLFNHYCDFILLIESCFNEVYYSVQPAQIAGCKTVVLATPPTSDGSICKVFVFIF